MDSATTHLIPDTLAPLVLTTESVPGVEGRSCREALGFSAVDWAEGERVEAPPACLIFTSGSTSAPRGVVVSHQNIAFSAQAIQRRLGYREDDTVGLFLPLSFDYGLYQIFLTLQVGATLYLGRPGLAGPPLLASLAKARVTVLPGVPTLFASMLRLLERRGASLPGLRSITNTGDHLPRSNIERLQARLPGLAVFCMYGLTECKRVSILLPEELSEKPGSVGRPLPGTEAWTVSGHGERLPPGTVGELVVRGPHVTRGYFEAENETAARFCFDADGVGELATGDLCRIDRDGYIYFVGREDCVMKHRGFRLSAAEVEDVACRVPGVVEAALVKAPGQDELHLYLVWGHGAPNVGRVLGEIRGSLEPHKVPEKVIVSKALPRTPHGKVDRRQLAEEARVPA